MFVYYLRTYLYRVHTNDRFILQYSEPEVPAESVPIEPPLHQVESLNSGTVAPEIPLEGMQVYMNPVEPLPQEEVPIVPPQPPVIEQQYFQQPRPISEVLGTAPFFFLQDSELDSPEQTPQNPVIGSASIPSQTFTNQNFVNMPESVSRQNQMPGFPTPNPPPPIPMPPSHMGGLEFVVPLQSNPIQAYNYQQSPVAEENVHQTHETTSRNSTEDTRDITKTNEGNESPRNGPRNNRTNNQKRNGPPNQGQGSYHQHPTYYQNNGYSSNTNKQRSNRGGQRQGGAGNRPMQHSQNKMKPAQH